MTYRLAVAAMVAADDGAAGNRCQPNGLACNEVHATHVAMDVGFQHFGDRLRTCALALNPDQAEPSGLPRHTATLISVRFAHRGYQPWQMAQHQLAREKAACCAAEPYVKPTG